MLLLISAGLESVRAGVPGPMDVIARDQYGNSAILVNPYLFWLPYDSYSPASQDGDAISVQVTEVDCDCAVSDGNVTQIISQVVYGTLELVLDVSKVEARINCVFLVLYAYYCCTWLFGGYIAKHCFWGMCFYCDHLR